MFLCLVSGNLLQDFQRSLARMVYLDHSVVLWLAWLVMIGGFLGRSILIVTKVFFNLLLFCLVWLFLTFVDNRHIQWVALSWNRTWLLVATAIHSGRLDRRWIVIDCFTLHHGWIPLLHRFSIVYGRWLARTLGHFLFEFFLEESRGLLVEVWKLFTLDSDRLIQLAVLDSILSIVQIPLVVHVKLLLCLQAFHIFRSECLLQGLFLPSIVLLLLLIFVVTGTFPAWIACMTQ